jgi:membrane protein
MAGRRSPPSDDLLLIAAATVLILTAQRYFQSPACRNSEIRISNRGIARGGHDAPERSQHGHGRFSGNPLQIPWAGWKGILWRTYVHTGEDRLLATAAGVVFFGLLAVFPAITALVSCYGLFANPSTIGANLQTLALMLPEGSFQIVQDQVARVLEKGDTALGATFVFGLALAIRSANAGVKAIIDALNVVYEEREKRSFVRLNLLSLAFTTGGIVALLLMVAAVVAFPLALDRLDLAPESQTIVSLARWPLLSAILLVALGVLYRFGPSRPPARWPSLGVSTLAASLLWVARLFPAVLVSLEFRKLQCNLWLAGRRDRADDVDVDVGHHRTVRCGTEFGDRAPDDARYNDWASDAAGRARSRHGRQLGTGGSGRIERTLALRINIDAKVALLVESATDACKPFPGHDTLDLRLDLKLDLGFDSGLGALRAT